MAMYEDVFQQSKKGNVPPKKSVFELIQKLSQSCDVAKTFENDVSILREKKNRSEHKLHQILKHYQRLKLMRLTKTLNTNKLYQRH